MVKPSKLYQQLRTSSGRTITFRELEQLLSAFGFVEKRRRGSHRSYRHPHVPELLTVQPRGKDAQPYQVRKLFDMISKYELEIDE